jgi:hypothetical protein
MVNEKESRCMNKTVEDANESGDRIIRITVDKYTYESGRLMLQSAIQLAHIHGMWDNEKAEQVFGEKGWLPPYDELEIAPKKEQK